MIMQECVRNTYRQKEKLVVVAVDFKKAYDSIKREKVVEVLKSLKVPIEIIDMMKRGYIGDRTWIEVGDEDIMIEVDSGIRQGCTISPLIFKLITYKIIEEMNRRTRGVRVGGIKVSSLFFADDGMMLAEGVEEAKRTVRSLREEARKYGLGMNMEKSKCMMFNMEQEAVLEIEGMEVVEELKHLCVKIEGKRNLYER